MITEVEFNDILTRLTRKYEVSRVYVSRDFNPKLGLENTDIVFVSACGNADDIVNFDTDDEDLKTLRRYGARINKEQEVAPYLWDKTSYKLWWTNQYGFNIPEESTRSNVSEEIKEFETAWRSSLSNLGVIKICGNWPLCEKALRRNDFTLYVICENPLDTAICPETKQYMKKRGEIKLLKFGEILPANLNLCYDKEDGWLRGNNSGVPSMPNNPKGPGGGFSSLRSLMR